MTSRVSKRFRSITAVASAAALIVGLAACGGGEATPTAEPIDDSPRVLVIGTNAALTSLDPARAAPVGVAFLSLIYESLVKRNPQAMLEPGLATEWELSDDAKEITLTLREGVTFQDGAKFDAAAVKANLDAAPARGGAIASQLKILTSVDVVDDYTVKLTMSRPASDILGMLASEAGMMISPNAIGNEDLATNPVGTGPFVLDEHNQTGVYYDKWEDYWNADRVKLDRIEMMTDLNDDQARLNAILTGEIDMTVIRSTQFEEVEARSQPGEFTIGTGPQATVIGLMINTANGAWGNPQLRIAVQHAIDRQGIVDALFGGSEGCQPVAQPFPTVFWANDNALEKSEYAEYDPELAKEIIDEAGLAGTAVKLYVGAATQYQNTAAAVQEQLKAIGLDVSVESFDNATLNELRSAGNFEVSVALVNSGRPDPAQFVQQFYTPEGVFNPGKWPFEGIAEPLAAMNATVDQDERAEYMHEIAAAVLEQGANVIPICSPTSVWMYTSEIDGVNLAVNWDYDWSYIYFTKDADK